MVKISSSTSSASSASSSFWKKNGGWSIATALLFVLSIVFLYYALDTFPGLYGHEADQVILWQDHDGPSALFVDTPNGEHHHVLLVLMVRFSRAVFGRTSFAVRFPVTLFVLATFFLLFIWSRRLEPTEPMAPWFHILIFSVHPMLLGFGRLGWEPGTAMFGAVLMWYPLFATDKSRTPFSSVLVFLLGATFVLMAHPVYLFFVLSVGAMALWESAAHFSDFWRSRARWTLGFVLLLGLIAQTIFLLVWVGWYRYFLWTIRFIWHVVEVLSGVRLLRLVTGVSWGPWHSVLVIATSIVSVVAGMSLFRLRRRWFWRSFLSLGMSITAFYLVLPWVDYFLGYGHQLLVLLCPFLFFVAAGLSVMPKELGRGLLLMYAVVCLLSLWNGYFAYGWKTENRRAYPTLWTGSTAAEMAPKRKAAKWLRHYINKHPKTTVYVGMGGMAKSLSFYLGKKPLYYWDGFFSRFYHIPWRQKNWVLVEFYFRGAPIWSLLKKLKARHIHYQIKYFRSGRKRSQVIIVRPK